MIDQNNDVGSSTNDRVGSGAGPNQSQQSRSTALIVGEDVGRRLHLRAPTAFDPPQLCDLRFDCVSEKRG
jgi:hypothetical protein